MAQGNLIINGKWDTSSGYGSVSYSYAMSTYDVTTAQYCQFLNAVAKADPYGLYCPAMFTATYQGTYYGLGGNNLPIACGIIQSGTSGNYSYRIATSTDSTSGHAFPANCANLPVNWDSWGDAARFANWLQNGQPTAAEGAGTTETGAYTLNGATTTSALFAITRNPGAKYWIPTENEWYKTAYYKGGGTNSGYWYYPTQSTSSNPPSSTLSTTGNNNANFNSSGLTSPNNWPLTPVGYYAGSPSHYGTFDQGGDLYNFTETAVTQSADNIQEGLYVRVIRGGSFHHTIPDELAANYRYGGDPAKYAHGRTFRLATAFLPVWNGAAAGGNNWSTLGNWTGDAPPVAGVAIQFGTLANGGHAASQNDLAAGTQFNGITFTSGAPSYSIQGDSIALSGPVTNQSANAQTISLAMQLVAGGGTFDTGATNLTVAGPISGPGMALTKIGSGMLALTGANTYTGPTTVSGGALVFAPGSLPPANALTIGNGMAAAISQSPAGSPSVSTLSALTIQGTGTLNLSNNDLVLSYSGASPYATYAALIQSGRILTSLPHPTPSTNAVVALVDNQMLHITVWHGATISSGSNFNELLFAYTYAGDVNLDGVVNQTDYYNVIANMGKSNATWFDGDLNGDGIVSPADLAIVTANLGAGSGGNSGLTLAAVFGPDTSAVPEPGCLSVLALASCVLLRRQRRTNCGSLDTEPFRFALLQ
ncbi:MAG: SUMF1/EgtB/PvdO family nonheme iron enzyme [Tepidisphaeraceae bacterium]